MFDAAPSNGNVANLRHNRVLARQRCPLTKMQRRLRLDWIGVLLMAVGIVLTLVGLSSGRGTSWNGGSAGHVAPLVIGVALASLLSGCGIVYIGWYAINCRAKSFEVSRHPGVIDTFGELVGCPFLSAIQCRKAESMNGMTVERGLLTLDHRIMAINPH